MTNGELEIGSVWRNKKSGRLLVVKGFGFGQFDVRIGTETYTTDMTYIAWLRDKCEFTGATFDLRKALEEAVEKAKGTTT